MELRRLRLLYELERLGTVAAVADALAFSPSSVSVQLSELEREAGVQLLRRAGRRLEFTAAGKRLAAHAGAALDADESVRAEMASLGESPSGRLRMSIVQTPALALLPGALSRLDDTAPELRIEVIQRETAPALEALRARALDLVVGIEYAPLPVPRHRDVDRQELLAEDMLLALPPRPAGRAPGPVSLKSCADEPWASGHRGTGLDAVISNVANRLGGFEPDVRHRSDDGLVLSSLVSAGRAITLLPALLIATVPGVSARPITEERLQRTIFTATRSSHRHAPAVQALRAALAYAAVEIQERVQVD